MKASDLDTSFVAEALPIFISEANEQVESIEQLLLQLETAPDDPELLGALFRCAHTVKGSAGIFGLDAVVAFTHHVENLLDRLRAGEVAFTPDLSTLLLQSNDQIRVLIIAAQDPQADSPEHAEKRTELVAALEAAARPGLDSASATPAAAATGEALPAKGNCDSHRPWHLSVQFGADTFRNGMDPVTILSYLGGLGHEMQVVCDGLAVPALQDLEPESCHFALEISLCSEASQAEIESAFSFVREDCSLHILSPDSAPQDFIDRIQAMPTMPRLGDLLVAVGAINASQLKSALKQQAISAHAPGEGPKLGAILQSELGLHPQIVEAALQKQSTQRVASGRAAPAPVDDTRFIRVQADRLDMVINLLGELVIAGAGAQLMARQSRQRTLIEANTQIGRLIEEIRNGTLQLRMVPIGETFSRLRRVVRDTAAELGKEVELKIEGGETELDKSVVERIADPLMHLVRNGLDHGLETPGERLASGKPRQGQLVLSACHESGSILIRIKDDGRGIQRQKVLERAWDRKLIERGVVPSEADLLNLIFEPGFSTAEKVTNLSGRGVGMDVVRRNVEALRGTVQIESQEGTGSVIQIRLPLTLAIIDGFLIAVGTSKFIFPLEAVVEVIESRPTNTPWDDRGCSTVELRGQVLPVLSLRQLYGLDTPEPERSSVVVIQSGGQRYGVMVDQLLGQHQTVIKPLGRMFRSLRGMSGSSILGNGEVALIFDVNTLRQLAAGPPGSAHPHSKHNGSQARSAKLTPTGEPS